MSVSANLLLFDAVVLNYCLTFKMWGPAVSGNLVFHGCFSTKSMAGEWLLFKSVSDSRTAGLLKWCHGEHFFPKKRHITAAVHCCMVVVILIGKILKAISCLLTSSTSSLESGIVCLAMLNKGRAVT